MTAKAGGKIKTLKLGIATKASNLKLAYICSMLSILALAALLFFVGNSTALYWRLQDVPYFLYYKVLRPNYLHTPKLLKIPKNIYQTWYTRDLHPSIEHKITRLRLANPSYKYILFIDDEMNAYVQNNFGPDIVSAYNRLNIITAKADFWRYLLLFKEGGIYLDMDGAVVGSLDDLLESTDEAVISEEIHRPFFIQWGLVFRAGHPILRRTIELVLRNIHRNTARSVHSLTGPTVFSEAIHSLYYSNYHMHYNHSALPDYSPINTTYHVFDNITQSNSTFRLVGWFSMFQKFFRFKQYTDALFHTHGAKGGIGERVHWRKQELYTPLLVNATGSYASPTGPRIGGDRDKATQIPPPPPAPQPRADAHSPALAHILVNASDVAGFNVGDQVQARYYNGTMWFHGIVHNVTMVSTGKFHYDLVYDDGSQEKSVSEDKMRRMEHFKSDPPVIVT